MFILLIFLINSFWNDQLLNLNADLSSTRIKALVFWHKNNFKKVETYPTAASSTTVTGISRLRNFLAISLLRSKRGKKHSEKTNIKKILCKHTNAHIFSKQA